MQTRNRPWHEVLFPAGLFLVLAVTSGCGDASPVPSTVSAHTALENTNAVTHSVAKPPTDPTSAASETAPTTALTPAQETQPDKPKRKPIYQEEFNGRELITAALVKAQRDHKHVLIEWGGNWCGWCYRLHDVFTQNKIVKPIVFEEFELVLIDSNKNQDLMHEYGGKDEGYSFPHLTVLDAEGKVLTNQNTEPLEEGKEHNPAAVAEFLKQWLPEKLHADAVMTEALQQANAENKRVLARFGTPYCGWCKVLAQFMQDHANLFAQDYVDVKIDTLRMTGGEEVAAKYRPTGSLGDPWMVILDGSGQTMATSVAGTGNIGYPYQPQEVEHFITMLRQTRQNLSDADLDSIAADLTSYREARERKLADQKAAQQSSAP